MYFLGIYCTQRRLALPRYLLRKNYVFVESVVTTIDPMSESRDRSSRCNLWGPAQHTHISCMNVCGTSHVCTLVSIRGSDGDTTPVCWDQHRYILEYTVNKSPSSLRTVSVELRINYFPLIA